MGLTNEQTCDEPKSSDSVYEHQLDKRGNQTQRQRVGLTSLLCVCVSVSNSLTKQHLSQQHKGYY